MEGADRGRAAAKAFEGLFGTAHVCMEMSTRRTFVEITPRGSGPIRFCSVSPMVGGVTYES